jgi:DNA-binding SARP family transcriptional activator
MCPPVNFDDIPRSIDLSSRGSETVRVTLLGSFTILVGSRTIKQDEWRLRKAANLIELLALAPGHSLYREQLMEALWPDLGTKAASNNLRRVLHSARKTLDPALGSRYLASEEGRLALCPGGMLWVDVEAFEEAAVMARREREPAAYRAALDLYSGGQGGVVRGADRPAPRRLLEAADRGQQDRLAPAANA